MKRKIVIISKPKLVTAILLVLMVIKCNEIKDYFVIICWVL